MKKSAITMKNFVGSSKGYGQWGFEASKKGSDREPIGFTVTGFKSRVTRFACDFLRSKGLDALDVVVYLPLDPPKEKTEMKISMNPKKKTLEEPKTEPKTEPKKRRRQKKDKNQKSLPLK